MKKRIISLLLTLLMAFSMVPMLSVGVEAKTAAQLTEAEAKEAGLEVYTAWYNTAMHSSEKLDAYNIAVTQRDENSPFNILYNLISNDEDYLSAIKAWKALNFSEDSVVGVLTDKEKAAYMVLIRNLMLGEDVELNSANMFDLNGQLVGTLLDFVGNATDHFLKDIEKEYWEGLNDSTTLRDLFEKTTDPAEKAKLLDKVIEIQQKNGDKAGLLSILSAVKASNEALKNTKSFLELLQNTIGVNKVLSLDSSYYEVIYGMAKASSASEGVIEAAKELYGVKFAYDEVGFSYLLPYIVGEKALEELCKGTTEITFEAIKKIPGVSEIVLARDGARLVCDLLFDTDDTNAIVYNILKMAEIEDALFVSVGNLHDKFLNDPTEENAKNFNTGMRLIYRYYIGANQYAYQYAVSVYDGGIIGKILGNKKAYQSWVEAYEFFDFITRYDLYAYDYNPSEDYAYLIIYHDDNDRVIAHQSVVNDEKVKIYVQPPIKEGEVCVGWATTKFPTFGTVIYEAGKSYTITSDTDVNLYPIWIKSNQIIFDAQSGQVSPSSLTFLTGESVTLPTPTRTGYKFLGWSENKNANEGEYTTNKKHTFAEGDLTLYAIWTPDTGSSNPSGSVPNTFDAAKAIVDFSSTAIGVTKGRIRYMTQLTVDTDNFVTDYWKYTVNNTTGTLSSGDKCTRCALSMALSYLGLDYTPGYMSTLYGSSDIPSPMVDVPALIPSIERVNADFDVLFNNYVGNQNYSPVVMYFDYKHPDDGKIHQHAIMIIGQNGNTYYAVDSAANKTKLVELTFNADKTAISTCSYARYADTSSVRSFSQWKLTGTPDVESRVYTIMYDWGDYVDGVVQTKKYDIKKHGVNYTISTEVPRYGSYVFKGWAVYPNLQTPAYQPGTTYTANKDEVFYAVWGAPEASSTAITLAGTIKDATVGGANYGNPLSGVKVEFFDSTGTSVGTATTVSDGTYTFTFPAPGTYKKVMSKEGYNTFTVDTIIIVENTPSLGISTMTEVEKVEERNIIADGTCGTDLTWALDDEGLLTIDGTGMLGEEWYTASMIPWHSYRGSINNVIISEGITSIGTFAFSNCVNLTNVSIPESVTTIDSHAFSSCTALTNIVLPNSIRRMKSQIFDGCSNLTQINYPKNLSYCQGTYSSNDTNLKMGPFASSGIKTIIIPEGVTTIPSYAFAGCINLTSVNIPNSVTSLGEHTFSNCRNLTSILIPNSVTSIGEYAFSDCRSITSIIIPGSISYIDYHAFSNCTNLTDVVISSGVRVIYRYAFAKCVNLTNVSIPESVTTIEGHAFSSCTALTNIVLPNSVNKLGSEIFAGCSNLTQINYPQNLSTCGGSYTSADYDYYYGPFARSNIKKIIIPDGVTTIPTYTFAGCTSLTGVSIPDSVTLIGELAFSNCKMLSSVIIPSSVKTIQRRAFFCCTKLTGAYFYGNAPSSFGSDVFKGSDSTFTIYYFDGATGWCNPWNGYRTSTFIPEDSPVIKVSDVRGNPSGTITVPVVIVNNPGIASMTLNVEYDESVFTLTSVVDTGLIPGSMHTEKYSSPYILTWENDTAKENYTANGILVNLVFTVAENAELGDYTIKVSYPQDGIFDTDVNNVDFYMQNGTVTVSNIIIGDATGDGALTNKDRVYLARYLAGWEGYDESVIDQTAADVNCDGALTNKDRVYLARHLAGWEGYETLPIT